MLFVLLSFVPLPSLFQLLIFFFKKINIHWDTPGQRGVVVVAPHEGRDGAHSASGLISCKVGASPPCQFHMPIS